MKKTGFYIIKDKFFEDMPDPYLKGNKAGNRPHYYCFEDNGKEAPRAATPGASSCCPAWTYLIFLPIGIIAYADKKGNILIFEFPQFCSRNRDILQPLIHNILYRYHRHHIIMILQ